MVPVEMGTPICAILAIIIAAIAVEEADIMIPHACMATHVWGQSWSGQKGL